MCVNSLAGTGRAKPSVVQFAASGRESSFNKGMEFCSIRYKIPSTCQHLLIQQAKELGPDIGRYDAGPIHIHSHPFIQVKPSCTFGRIVTHGTQTPLRPNPQKMGRTCARTRSRQRFMPHSLSPSWLGVVLPRRSTSLPGEAVGPGDLPAPWDPISLDQLLQGLGRGDTNGSGPWAPQRNSGKRNGLEDWLGLDGTGVRTGRTSDYESVASLMVFVGGGLASWCWGETSLEHADGQKP